MHAAHQPIDAEGAAERDRTQLVVARRRHDFHPRRRARVANGGDKPPQHRGVGADVLKADMFQGERPRDLDEIECVLDRRVVARQHEDEVHQTPPAFIGVFLPLRALKGTRHGQSGAAHAFAAEPASARGTRSIRIPLLRAFRVHVPGHHPLRALADRLPAYRRRADGVVQLALRQALRRQRFCCASRTPTASARPKRRSRRSSTGSKWLGLDWDGEAISQFARAERHREVVDADAGDRRRLPLLRQRRGARGDARRRRALEGKPMRYDGRWRDRDPAEAPPGVAPVIRLRARTGGRDDHRRQGAGQGRLRQQGSRRPRAAALGRQPDLHARRRRRRSRHGRHPRHPRRRSPDQRRAADADLSGARLGRPGHGRISR